MRHVVTEVGDGNNLVDQDFQTAQQDMNHARAGGMDLLNAQNIIDALETGRALGVLNVAMDLGTRALEPKKNPTALRGIDLLLTTVRKSTMRTATFLACACSSSFASEQGGW